MSYETRAQKKKKKQKRPPFLMTSLPDDVLVDILARVPRCNYPTLSIVSKRFQSLVMSNYIYERRNLLGCTESCIYVTKHQRLHILSRKPNNNDRLILIPTLQVIPRDASFVSVGSKIFVFGNHNTKSVVLTIDLRSHRAESLPSMPMPLTNIVADIIDGKIYVIGYSIDKKKNFMVVFDIETQMWESEKTNLDIGYIWSRGSVVMADKIYMRDSHNSFVYVPKENKWETDKMLNSKKWGNACVVDDIIYYYDFYKKKLRAYDPKQRRWRVVKGLELSPYPWSSHTVNYGGKLVMFLRYDEGRDTWRAEITLERRQGGEIWGKVEWCGAVSGAGHLLLWKPLVIMV